MKLRKRFKNALVLLISLVMVVSAASPILASAAIAVDDSKMTLNNLTSKTDYNVVPGVMESHIVTHKPDGSGQVKTYALEVDLKNPNVGVLASYKNYMNSLATNPTWGMQTVRDQAAATESYYRDVKGDENFKIVGGTNGDYFNMGSGAPTGPLIMNGVKYNENSSWNYFAILKDGTPVIRQAGDPDYAEKMAEAQQLVGGPIILIKDGVIPQDIQLDTATLPRTVVGIKPDNSVVFLVADGRQAPESCGYTLMECAEELMALGCNYGINLDGGGSATMISRHEGDNSYSLLNSPSDGVDRTVSTALLIYSNAAPDGQFSRASIEPNNEVYTPNSEVEFTATGADSSGASVPLPEDGSFALADGSYGKIEGNKFISNGKEGTVTVNYMSGGTARGSTSIEIRKPNQITFDTDEVSLGFEEETDFGINVLYKNRDVHFNVGDIIWTKEKAVPDEQDPNNREKWSYVPDDANELGAFNGNVFTTSPSNSITGRITAAYSSDNSIKASVIAVIGKMPKVIWDFETPEDYNICHGSYALRAETTENLLDDVRNCSDYEEGKTNFALMHYEGRGVAGHAEIIDMDSGEVRMGTHALKIDYDYSQWDRGTTDGLCFGAVDEVVMEGNPTGVGVWVYAPEGTPNFWVRMYYRDATTNRLACDLTESAGAADGVGGINWTGWRYLEGKLEGSPPFSSFTAGSLRFMATGNSGKYTVTGGYEKDEFGKDTEKLNKKEVAPADAKGSIYIDNVQFVYGTNTDDTINPVIDTIEVGHANGDNMTNIGNGTKVDSNDVYIRSTFHDVENKYSTGINYDNIRLYLDNKDVTSEVINNKDDIIHYYGTLGNGVHSVKVLIRDGFNNETSETRYFTVEGDASFPTVKITPATEKAVLNSPYTIALSSNAITKISNVNANIKLDGDIVPSREAMTIDYAKGFAGESSYDAATGTLSLNITGDGSAAETDADFDSIASITVTIPKNTVESKNYTYRILEGSFTYKNPGSDKDSILTFSSMETAVPVEATYKLAADPVIVGAPAKFIATDQSGAPVEGVNIINYDGDAVLGVTDSAGAFQYDGFSEAPQKFSVYAEKDGSYSFAYSSQSAQGACDPGGAPSHVLVNASVDGSLKKNISWITNPLTSSDAMVEYALKSEYDRKGDSAFIKVKGSGALNSFFSNADVNQNYIARINNVVINGLQENTEYVFRAGNGGIMSDLKSFSTPLSHGDVNFFLFGDIQADDTTNVTNLLNAVGSDGVDYDFGIQTGDSIDDAGNYLLWDDVLKVYTNDSIANTELIHVLGNHEYMGDAEADAAGSIYNLPDKNYYSVTYGNVYVAVINYMADLDSALAWLKEDAGKSDATWKILTMHAPAYGTNAAAPSENITAKLPKVAQEVGLTAVFSGHDHSYARTAPMTDLTVDEQNGVSYFICGSSGEKSYAVTKNPEYNFKLATNDYTSVYISVTATDTTFTVNAYDVNGENRMVLDSFEKKASYDCAANGHKFVFENGMLACSVCSYRRTLAAYRNTPAYTGPALDKSTNTPISFKEGALETNRWLGYESNVYYLGADGRAVKGEQTIDGYKYVFDDECKLTRFAFVLPNGTLAKNQWVSYEESKTFYYVGEDGLAISGEIKLGNHTYTFGEDGKLTRGDFVKEGGKWFYYIAGEKQRGWWKVDGYWRYFDRVHGFPMVTGKFTISSTDMDLTFTADSEGRLIKGAWYTNENGTSYYWADNERVSGWQVIEDSFYYFGENSYMATGLQEIDGKNYTFGEDGKLMLTSDTVQAHDCFNETDYWYLFDASGDVVKDHIKDHPYQKAIDAAVPATPTSAGLTEGEHCELCGFVLVPQHTIPPLGQEPDSTEPDSNNSEEPTTPGGGEEPTTPGGNNEPTTPGGNNEPTTPGGNNEPTTPGGNNEPTKPGGNSEPTTPGGNNEPTTPGGGEEPTKPGGNNEPTTPGGGEEPTKPGGNNEPTTPGGNNEPTKPGGGTEPSTGPKELIMGDLNGDGKITAADARVALRISAKLVTPTDAQLRAADSDANGIITAYDARCVLRVSAKLEPESKLGHFDPPAREESPKSK